MRLKYYMLTLRQMNKSKSFVLFVISVITVILLLIIMTQNFKPTIEELCDEKAKSMALQASNSAIYKSIENISYEDLTTIKQDSNGKITALIANASIMNKIINEVTTNTEKLFEEYNKKYIDIPISSFLGLNFFSGHSFRMKINMILTGSVKAEFKSSFESAGINQTKHRIYIDVSTSVKSIAPFFLDQEEYTNTIMIAETVLVGDIPSTYYDIQGINDLKQKDTLDIIQNAN